MRKSKAIFTKILVGLFVLSAVLSQLPISTVFAAPSPVTVYAVDYEEENIIINNNQNTRIYFATEIEASKDNWEVIDADAGATTTIDFSWLSPTIDNTLVFKGEQDPKQTRVTILEQTRKLDVSISYSNLASLKKTDTIGPLLNIMSSAGTADTPIQFSDLEWKKGDGGKWKDYTELTVAQLEKYQVKGTYLYFRIKADNDDSRYVSAGRPYPDGTMGRRASSEVKVKIAKKSSPMVVGIDGEEFTAEIRYGKEYRVTTTAGTTGWIKVIDKAVRSLPLSTIVNNGSDGTTAAKAFPAMFLEIRDYATPKAAASKITEITLDAQRIIPGTIINGKAPTTVTSADDDIYIAYNGTKNMIITIPSASPDNPYEYCVVKPNDYLDLTRAVWTSITKGTENKVLSSKAVEGGKLYIRQSEIKSKEATRTSPAVAYALASTYLMKPISYPSIPVADKDTYVFTKGYSNSITFSIKLNVAGKEPFETQIKSIKLGTKDIGFSYTVSPALGNPIDTSNVYTMNVTLLKASLETMTNCYGRPITIYFNNGTTDKTSVKLTIQSPTPAYTLTATAAKGSATGTTAITVVSSLGAGNSFVYTVGTAEVKGKNTEDTITNGTAFTSGADIAVTAGNYITIYEINTTTKKIVKYKSIQITADMIK